MTTNIVQVQTYCPFSRKIETLDLRCNVIRGAIVSGEVKGCEKTTCPNIDTKNCLIEQPLTTSLI